MTEMQTITSNVIHIKHFHSNATGRNYLVLTADNESSRNNLLNNNSITLFGQNLKVEPPIEKNKNRNRQQMANGSNNVQSPDPGRPRQRPTGPNTGSRNVTHPRMPQPPPPPPRNTWEQCPIWPPLPYRQTRPIPQNLHQSSRNYGRPNFSNEQDIKFFINATTSIISALHEGKEDPFEFIAGVNNTFVNHNLPVIEIPYSQIILSRKIFEKKSMTTTPSFLPTVSRQNHTSNTPSNHFQQTPASTHSQQTSISDPSNPNTTSNSLPTSLPVHTHQIPTFSTPSSTTAVTTTIYVAPIPAATTTSHLPTTTPPQTPIIPLFQSLPTSTQSENPSLTHSQTPHIPLSQSLPTSTQSENPALTPTQTHPTPLSQSLPTSTQSENLSLTPSVTTNFTPVTSSQAPPSTEPSTLSPPPSTPTHITRSITNTRK